jgi:cell wall-associated NlpC family hydrolase
VLGVNAVNQDAASAETAVHSGEINGNMVRFRSGPGTTYSIIGTYNRGTALQITGSAQGWTQAIIDGVSGYVFSDYVKDTGVVPAKAGSAEGGQASAVLGQTGTEPGSGQAASEQVSQTLGLNESSAEVTAPTDGYINGNGVRLRQAPSMTAAILNENLNTGNTARILGSSGDWTHVIVNGQEGFVYSAYVTEGRYEPAGSIRRAAGSDLGKEIADYALSFLGTRYTWGGKSPATGFDCSGFVQYVFSQFGYTTSSIANDVRNEGVHVDPADIQPGDVLCFYSGNNYVGHVGIYIGDNTFVHAANSEIGVVTTSLAVGYYAQRGYEIRRII